MHRHLVAVKIGVVSGANQRMDFNGPAFRQHRLKRLNAEAVKRRGAVQQNRMLANDFFEHIPDFGTHALDHPLGALDVVGMTGVDQFLHNKRLEQFQRHFFRQTALVKFQLRSDHDNRSARIVHALAKQVLAEPALFSLEHVAQGF